MAACLVLGCGESGYGFVINIIGLLPNKGIQGKSGFSIRENQGKKKDFSKSQGSLLLHFRAMTFYLLNHAPS